LLERPAQLEVAHLLLQRRSTRDCAETPEVDGLDSEFRAPERDSCFVAVACHFAGSNMHHVGQGSRDWRRGYHGPRSHYSYVPGVRVFVLTHEMSAPKKISK
jgi:hypothetical protein